MNVDIKKKKKKRGKVFDFHDFWFCYGFFPNSKPSWKVFVKLCLQYIFTVMLLSRKSTGKHQINDERFCEKQIPLLFYY